MIRKVLILGSTGSIGTQTLDVIQSINQSQPLFDVVGLVAGRNIELLAKQITKFKPDFVSVKEPEGIDALRNALPDHVISKFFSGNDGILELIESSGADLVVNGLVGALGLAPTLKAIELGIDVALANKESLVIGGHLVKSALENSPAKLIPVDSEHNALFQLLEHRERASVAKVILTASGGALRDFPIVDLPNATPKTVLKHPNWAMGQRITVDSATLVNKGFEVIEAKWLFDVEWDAIEAIIHPQSAVHGLVELTDGSLLAHLGPTDMRAPIQHTLLYPHIPTEPFGHFDIASQQLEFRPVDPARYPAFEVVLESGKIGGSAPAVVNAADEVAVERFLSGEIAFGEIAKILAGVLDDHEAEPNPNIEALQNADQWARAWARNW